MEELYNRCLRCHRVLKTDEARKLGYGKICFEKAKTGPRVINIFDYISGEDNEKRKKTN